MVRCLPTRRRVVEGTIAENNGPERPWLPWVGEHWGRDSRFGSRVLVVGESHYNSEPELHEQRQADRNFTRDVVQTWGVNAPSGYFLRMGRILLRDGGAGHEAVAAAWQQVAFCNYVARLLEDGEQPTVQDWADGRPPFEQTLDDLKPDAVLVTGLGVWNHGIGNAWAPHIRANPPGLPAFGAHRHPRVASYLEAFQIVDWLFHRAWQLVG